MVTVKRKNQGVIADHYICRGCQKKINFDNRFHLCEGRGRQQGKPVAARVIYLPNYSALNKQNTVPGYMKRFGSRPLRVYGPVMFV